MKKKEDFIRPDRYPFKEEYPNKKEYIKAKNEYNELMLKYIDDLEEFDREFEKLNKIQ